jgi:hypothetical protein
MTVAVNADLFLLSALEHTRVLVTRDCLSLRCAMHNPCSWVTDLSVTASVLWYQCGVRTPAHKLYPTGSCRLLIWFDIEVTETAMHQEGCDPAD